MKKQMLAAMLITSLLLSGCDQTGEASSSSDLSEASCSSAVNNASEETSDEEEPTDEELIELFSNAMYEINELATVEPTLIVSLTFDHEVEIDYSDTITIKPYSYVRTSRRYSELEDHYAQFFTGETLDWIMSTKFADIDGTLYCCLSGGASSRGFKFLSLEKLQGNTYKGTYLAYHTVKEGEEESTVFEVKKTDAGYRISNIDYHPDPLGYDMPNEQI